jgi:thiamine-phosphate pyrophosphorylase
MPLSRQRHLICLVTDRHRLSLINDAAAVDRLIALVGAAGKAGIDLVQVRERDLEARELAALLRNCVAAVAGTETKVVVNDRADVALTAGAHGVHLRSDSIDAGSIRRLLPQDALIGRSVHSAKEAAEVADAGGLDYLIFGTLFPTVSKDEWHRSTSVSELSNACALTPLPILAIGGMTPDRAQEVAKAGAAGVAAIGLFLPPTGVPADRHLHLLVEHLRRVFDTCGAVP